MKTMHAGALLLLVSVAVVATSVPPDEPKATSGWLMRTTNTLCWGTPGKQQVCVPAESTVRIASVTWRTTTKNITIVPSDALFSDGFE